jgi:hypothetical protein
MPLPEIKITGPMWTANATILKVTRNFKVGEPQESRTSERLFRSHFLGLESQTVWGSGNTLTPGTLDVYCCVTQLTLTLFDTLYNWSWGNTTGSSIPIIPPVLQDGIDDATLQSLAMAPESFPEQGVTRLQLVADAAAWNNLATGNTPQFTCTGGEIYLGVLGAGQTPSGLHLDQAAKQLSGMYDSLPDLLSPGPPDPLYANAGGIRVPGYARFPWMVDDDTTRVYGQHQISPEMAAGQLTGRVVRMIDTRSLDSPNAARLGKASQSLIDVLTASTDGANTERPIWARLEARTGTDPSTFTWLQKRVPNQNGSPAFKYTLTVDSPVNVLLSDQRPELTSTVRTLARLAPDTLSIQPIPQQEGFTVGMQFGTPPDHNAPPPTPPQVEYDVTIPAAGDVGSETIALTNVTVAFDPLQIPADLRTFQESALQLASSPGKPPLLWAAMRLEDGWAQLPVLNLDAEDYIKSGAAQNRGNHNVPAPQQSGSPNGLFSGAVTFGNTSNQPRAEQPWSFTLTGAGAFQGTWIFGAPQSQTRAPVKSISLTLWWPVLDVDGLVWFSTETPTVEDALPTGEDFAGGLISVPLSTLDPAAFYPPAMDMGLNLKFSLRSPQPPTNPTKDVLTASISAWDVTYGVNADLTRKVFAQIARTAPFTPAMLQDTSIPGPNTAPFFAYALNWQRHPALPLIQALPLAQSARPPAFPSPNRCLAPRQLSLVQASISIPAERESGLPPSAVMQVPSGWKYGIKEGDNSGAAQWPVFLPADSPPAVAPAWASSQDLPMVSLSLPGLVYLPAAPAAADGGGLEIPNGYLPAWNLRHDQPMLDELNALATVQSDDVPQTADPQTNPITTPQPLMPSAFSQYWNALAQQATLAAAQGTGALTAGVGVAPATVTGLIGTKQWPVQVEMADAAYPGRLILTDASAAVAHPAIHYSDQPLAGISGVFVDSGATLALQDGVPPPDTTAYQITSGSLAWPRPGATAVTTSRLDQHGTVRYPTAPGDVNSLLTTRLTLANGDDYQLTTLRTPVGLVDGQGMTVASIWFRDLPMQGNRFTSPINADTDVNLPDSLDADRDATRGYEWRIQSSTPAEARCLTLCGLNFWPLTLDAVQCDAQGPTSLTLKGRLQLPLNGQRGTDEIASLNTYVQVVFTGPLSPTGTRKLRLSSITPLPNTVTDHEWPLTPLTDLTEGDPRILWTDCSYDANANTITINNARLQFFLMGVRWTVGAPPLTFKTASSYTVSAACSIAHLEPGVSQVVPLAATLNLTLASGVFTINLAVQLGATIAAAADRPALAIGFTAALLPASGYSIDSARLFTDKVDSTAEGVPVLLPGTNGTGGPSEPNPFDVHARGLTLTWSSLDLSGGTPQLLQGMYLAQSQATGSSGSTRQPVISPAPGYATFVFDVQETPAAPNFDLKYASLETLFTCRWGDPLMAESTLDSAPDLMAAKVFSSSAGNLMVDYRLEWHEQATANESFLFNGILEIRNLLSWPLDLTPLRKPSALYLPNINDSRAMPLNHVRHSMRVLFNQHSLPPVLLSRGNAGCLLQIPGSDLPGGSARAWQFVAVTEHQLLDIVMTCDDVTGEVTSLKRGAERRWSAVQEVRLISVQSFRAFLSSTTALATPSPVFTLDAGQERYATPLSTNTYGYFSGAMCTELINDLSRLFTPPAPPETHIIVEATAIHWLRAMPDVAVPSMALERLPIGNLEAGLTNQADYDTKGSLDSDWLMVTLPFLGRMQTLEDVSLDQNAGAGSPFVTDPVLQLLRQRMLEQDFAFIARAFSSWNQGVTALFRLSAMDFAAGRSRAQLPFTTLQEAFYRLMHPVSQPAALPDAATMVSHSTGPAQLSTPGVLARSFDTRRQDYPPATPADYQLPAGTVTRPIQWRENSLAVIQAVTDPTMLPTNRELVWWPAGLVLSDGGVLDGARVVSAAINQAGTRAAIAFADGYVYIYDLSASPPAIYPLEIDEPATAVAFGYSGTRLAVAYGKQIQELQLNAGNWQPLHSITYSSRVTCLAYGNSDLALYSGGTDGYVCVWDDARSNPPMKLPQDNRGSGAPVSAIALDSTGEFLAASVIDTAHVWKLDPGGPLRLTAPESEIDHSGAAITGLAFAPNPDDGTPVRLYTASAASDGNNLIAWDFARNSLQHRHLCMLAGGISALAVSIKGVVAAGGYSGQVLVLNRDLVAQPGMGAAPDPLRSQLVPITSLAFDPTNTYLVTACLDGNVKSWLVAEIVGTSPWSADPMQNRVQHTSGVTALACGNRLTVSGSRTQAILAPLLQGNAPQQSLNQPPLGKSTYLAATLLPAQITGNPMPATLAVSPYTHFDLAPVTEPQTAPSTTYLVSAELLCLQEQAADQTARTAEPPVLAVRASILRSVNDVQKATEDLIIPWAQQARNLICPDSPVAVIRMRIIATDGTSAQSISVSYRFAALPAASPPARLASRAFALRASPEQLHFLEGQFCTAPPPAAPPSPFEIAPPQITSVLPIRSTPAGAWGNSGLSISVRYAQRADGPDSLGIVGSTSNGPDPLGIVGSTSTSFDSLWWNGLHSYVRFRENSAGLPPLFRGEAIKALLPAPPNRPLPFFAATQAASNSRAAQSSCVPTLDGSSASTSRTGTPVLPGAVRWMISQPRPGVSLALRPNITRQSGITDDAPGLALISGSIPVDHRTPRPVDIPANPAAPLQSEQKALQPWASQFEPQSSCVARPSAVDFALFGSDNPVWYIGLRCQLFESSGQSPLQSVGKASWLKGDNPGGMTLHIQSMVYGATINPGTKLQYAAAGQTASISAGLYLSDGKSIVPYSTTVGVLAPDGTASITGKVMNNLNTLQQMVGLSRNGDKLTFQLALTLNGADYTNWTQNLTFPVRIYDETLDALPLEPRYVYFEDPEYSALLSTETLHSERSGRIPAGGGSGSSSTTNTSGAGFTGAFRLSVDRRECNPDTVLVIGVMVTPDQGSQALPEVGLLICHENKDNPVPTPISPYISVKSQMQPGKICLTNFPLEA